jgi:hypothetical protein
MSSIEDIKPPFSSGENDIGPENPATGDLALERETRDRFLSQEEVHSVRLEREVKSWTYRERFEFQVGERAVTLTEAFRSYSNYDPKNHNNPHEVTDLKRERKYDEYILVNALAKQDDIAKLFNIPLKALRTRLNLDYLDKNGFMMSSGNNLINMTQFHQHLKALKMGEDVTDHDIVVEFAGHIFHEAVHDIDDLPEAAQTLLNSKTSNGELSSITAQTAYYLAAGYFGPKSYDSMRAQVGLKEIEQGSSNLGSYGLATCLGAELLRRRIIEKIPELGSTEEYSDPITAVQEMCKKIKPENREDLVQALRQGVMDSTDMELIKRVLSEIKEKDTIKP